MANHRSCVAGDKYGLLTVIEAVESTPSGILWRCACDCGGERTLLTGNLKASRVGCKECESARRSAAVTTHGETRGKVMPRLYSIWAGMHKRCSNPKSKSWKYYGGKGIAVCEQWTEYVPFRDWAMASGYAENLTIDRLNSARHYEPSNCEWVTASENSRRAQAARAKARAN